MPIVFVSENFSCMTHFITNFLYLTLRIWNVPTVEILIAGSDTLVESSINAINVSNFNLSCVSWRCFQYSDLFIKNEYKKSH